MVYSRNSPLKQARAYILESMPEEIAAPRAEPQHMRQDASQMRVHPVMR